MSGRGRESVVVINRGHLSPDEMSGGEVIAMSLCKYWSGKGLHVKQICTSHTPAIWSGFYEGSVEYITLDSGSRPLPAYLKRSLNALWLKLPEAPAAVYSASDFIYDVLPAYRLKRKYPDARWYAGLYLLVKMPRPRDFIRSPRAALRRTLTFLGQRLAMTLMNSAADAVFVLNETDAGKVRNSFEEHARVHVFPLGIDVEKAVWAVPGKQRCDAIYLGAIHPRKGIEDLLRAWSLVVEKIAAAKLLLVGHGETRYVEAVRSLAKSLYIEKNVSFQGPEKGSEKYAMLKAARIMVHPSYEESFALAILEGMACGLPVVAYDLDAYDEIYDAGMVRVPAGDFRKLADEIIVLLTDDGLRAGLAREARDISAGRDQRTLLKEFMSRNDFR